MKQTKRSLSQSTFLNTQSPLISSKINHFKEKFTQSQQKFYNNSSVHKNASSLSKMSIMHTSHGKRSMKQSPLKIILSSAGGKKVSQSDENKTVIINQNESMNPQKDLTLLNIKQSILLQELDSKAMQITRYTQKNSLLLRQRQNLQAKLANLKKQIDQQQKKLNDMKINCGNLANNIELTQQRYEEKFNLKCELTKKCNQILKINKNLQSEISSSKAQSKYNKEEIDLLQKDIIYLQAKVINTNISLQQEEALRMKLREKLSLELKVMENAAILYSQLTSQRECMNSQIDIVFNQNKLQPDQKNESIKSKLLMESKVSKS